MKSSILQILLIISIVFSFSLTALSQDNGDKTKNEEEIKSLITKYKGCIEKGDAENLLKIITSESKKKLEKELEKIKDFVKDMPREKKDVKITAFNKTPREIETMDLKGFLKWALSRLSEYDIKDMKDTELTEIKFAKDVKSASLSWKGENTVEAPKSVIFEDGTWKIAIYLG